MRKMENQRKKAVKKGAAKVSSNIHLPNVYIIMQRSTNLNTLKMEIKIKGKVLYPFKNWICSAFHSVPTNSTMKYTKCSGKNYNKLAIELDKTSSNWITGFVQNLFLWFAKERAHNEQKNRNQNESNMHTCTTKRERKKWISSKLITKPIVRFQTRKNCTNF